jgi:hypothetical protein
MTSRQAAALCYIGMAASACAAIPSSYVGAPKCQACHPAQFTSQSASAHAGALSPVSDHRGLSAGGFPFFMARQNTPAGAHILPTR